MSQPAAAATTCRTLVVEDDPYASEVLVRVLKQFGHEAETVRTVHQALRALERFKPTHILLDLMMPDGVGTEVLETIRKRGLAVKVAVITAVGPGSLYDQALALNPDAVLHKPWDMVKLRLLLLSVDQAS